MALIRKPVRGARAFGEKSDAAQKSQAAILLLMGHRLRGTHRISASLAMGPATMWSSVNEEVDKFPVPAIEPRTGRISTLAIRMELNRAHPAHFAVKPPKRIKRPVPPRVLKHVAQRAYRQKSHEAAAQLFEACLHHRSELVRVSAAASYFELSTESERLLGVLAQGAKAKDPLTRAVAATALARLDPTHSALAKLTDARSRRRRRTKAHTGMLIHGTWARGGSWWQPGGDFHRYILARVWGDLYAASDRFEWSGGLSDAARSLAAQQLAAWIDGKNAIGIKLMGHSHGANAAMLATHMTDKIKEIVLLSCPVHEDKYLPDFSRTPKVISFRVKLDLVILADGGAQRFSDARIDDRKLPLWFDHFATHDPAVWRKYNLPQTLLQEGF
jgi:hypothetical protein